MSTSFNIANGLAQMAAHFPERPAVIHPVAPSLTARLRTRWANTSPTPSTQFVTKTFMQLNQRCDAYAHGFAQAGLQPGERALVLLRPGLELIAVMFALFRCGVVPVLVDPGMGRRPFLQCVQETVPDHLIAIPVAHVLRRVFAKPFASVKRHFSTGFGGESLAELVAWGEKQGAFTPPDRRDDDEAGIFFTSGSTGVPKGVIYTQAVLRAQLQALRQAEGILEDDVHLAVFYAFALYNPALGATTVVPDMDVRRPGRANPANLVDAIERFSVTVSMGSPTVWRNVADYCEQQGRTLPTLARLHLFGAPVEPQLVRDLVRIMPNGTVSTPYGATEALPTTWITHHELLELPDDAPIGFCVGRPVTDTVVQVIPWQEGPIADGELVVPCRAGQVGEVVVRGSQVTAGYLHRPEQTARARLVNEDGRWHRMGDLGAIDEKGRLWIGGRAAHRVETLSGVLLSAPAETVFNRHPLVRRSALVGIGSMPQLPIIVIELAKSLNRQEKAALKAELLAWGQAAEYTRPIRKLLFYPGTLPTDVRHNAKILREQVAIWATQQPESVS